MVTDGLGAAGGAAGPLALHGLTGGAVWGPRHCKNRVCVGESVDVLRDVIASKKEGI